MRSDNVRRHDAAVGAAPVGFDPEFPILFLKAELPARADGYGDSASGQRHTTGSIADKEIANIEPGRPVLFRRRAHEAQETPQLVKLEGARKRQVEKIAEHGGDPQIHILPQAVEGTVSRIIAEQRRECQPRCGISGFGKGRFLRELTHTAGKPPAAYGPCRCTVPKLRVIFGPAAL